MCTIEQEMKIGKPHIHGYLIFMMAVLIAVGVFMTKRSAGDFNFEARQYPAGFRELILNSGASSRGQTSPLLVGLETGFAEQDPEPITDICKALFSDAADPTVGPAAAEVTIVEFFDYQCPYCRVVSEFLGEVQANDPRVRIVFKEWPVLGSDSEFAARAALASHEGVARIEADEEREGVLRITVSEGSRRLASLLERSRSSRRARRPVRPTARSSCSRAPRSGSQRG